MTQKADWRWVVLLLTVFAVLSIGSALQESPTYDEPLHILAGVAAWKTGQVDLDYSNPPLSLYWQTLPLLTRRFHSFPPAQQLFDIKRSYSFSFTHHNPYSLTWMLQVPRVMNVLLALFLGIVLFHWAKQALGGPAAKAALLAYAFCPMLLCYGHLATSDMAATLGWVLIFYTAWRWEKGPTSQHAVFVGLAIGVALCGKYSTLAALPVAAAALWYQARASKNDERTKHVPLGRIILYIFLSANTVMMLCYRGWGLPEWLMGLPKLAVQFQEGHLNYFWGRYSQTGWVPYFMTVFLLKTPLPFLIALLWGAVTWRTLDMSRRQFLAAWCIWPVAFIFLASSFSSIQVGIRHILPVYPLLCLWVGGAAASFSQSHAWARRAWILLGTLYIVGALAVFPRYLSYFNEVVGPNADAYKFFVDSNLDWGQGMKSLGDDLRKEGSPAIYLSYFGCTDPSLYGVHFKPVLMVTCADVGRGEEIPTGQSPLYFAISATNRVGLYYAPHNVFGWLDQRKPVKVIMDSIWLYDITNDADAKSRLRALTNSAPATP